jgi:uncharacterized C2H2 Zn-finger protein
MSINDTILNKNNELNCSHNYDKNVDLDTEMRIEIESPKRAIRTESVKKNELTYRCPECFINLNAFDDYIEHFVKMHSVKFNQSQKKINLISSDSIAEIISERSSEPESKKLRLEPKKQAASAACESFEAALNEQSLDSSDQDTVNDVSTISDLSRLDSTQPENAQALNEKLKRLSDKELEYFNLDESINEKAISEKADAFYKVLDSSKRKYHK